MPLRQGDLVKVTVVAERQNKHESLGVFLSPMGVGPSPGRAFFVEASGRIHHCRIQHRLFCVSHQKSGPAVDPCLPGRLHQTYVPSGSLLLTKQAPSSLEMRAWRTAVFTS